MYTNALSENVEIMSRNPNSEDAELDLGELLSALWAHKLLITLITGLSIFLAGYYAINTEKKFTARAIFEISESNSRSGFSFPKEVGALASIAGLATNSSSSSLESLLERVNGREFILNFNNKYSIDLDPYFNTYDPDHKDPLWRATLKKIIGWQKSQREKNAVVEHNVARNYRKNIGFDKAKKSDTITVSVTHIEPEKAASYANNIMEEIKLLVQSESDTAQRFQMNYLSETLADALQEMETAEENLKNYALENSALAQEIFITDSLKLDEMRMEKRKVKEISDLLSIVESLVKTGNLDSSSYETLRSQHPLVDDIEFRRILGMSETISAWNWPEVETIEAISATLKDRSKRLDIDIKTIEENAKIYATSAEDLAKFKREAKIAEATYIVLIEQVKSQSLAAGFQPETFKVFEYATIPLLASSPNIKQVLLLGTVIGIFIGVSLALINSKRRGVYNTRSAMVFDAGADLALRSRSIKRLSRKSISEIITFVSKRSIMVLDEAAVKISNKKVVYVFNSGGRPSASDATRLLATQSAKSGRRVVICDTTGQSEKEIKDDSLSTGSEFSTVETGENIHILPNTNGSYFFTSKKFDSTMKGLTKQFDQVFVCSSNSNAYLGLMALAEFVPSLVLIAGLRKTKKIDIKNVKIKQPIDVLFYE